MNEILSPIVAAAADKIKATRDQLLSERAALRAHRQEILTRLRLVERGLADCKAAARFFGLDIEFPSDEEDAAAASRLAEVDVRAAHARARAAEIAAEAQRAAAELAALEHARSQLTGIKAKSPEGPTGPSPAAEPRPLPAIPFPPAPPPVSRPTIRHLILTRLAATGDKGSKAAPIREWVETTFGQQIHEKTIGMSLYRLQKEGLVRRDGHLWFLVPLKAETENPGADTPGPINPET